MKVVYVAGPFRASTTWAIEKNVRRAEEAGLAVVQLGAMPLIPHCNTRYFHGLMPDQFFLDGTLELMRRCDVLLLTGEWRTSSGCLKEWEEAQRLKMPILFGVDDLRKYMERLQP